MTDLDMASLDRFLRSHQGALDDVIVQRVANDDGTRSLSLGMLRRLRDDIKQANAELAKYVGWEPTIKDEYDHVVDQADKVGEIVREFKRAHPDLWSGPDQNDAVTALIAAIENALEA